MVLLIFRTKLRLNSLLVKIRRTQRIITSLNLGRDLINKITTIESIFLKAKQMIIEQDLLTNEDLLTQFREELLDLDVQFGQLDQIAIVHSFDESKIRNNVTKIKNMAKEARGTISVILRNLPSKIAAPRSQEELNEEAYNKVNRKAA
ncbi:MAG: hypothetical protein ABIJ18_05010 [archaeon]